MGYGKWLGGFLGWILLGPIGGLVGFIVGSMAEGERDFYEKKIKYDTESGQRLSGQRNSFLVSLLVLSVAVIKSDGKFLKSELEYVKDFIRNSFGEQAVKESLRIMKGLIDKEIDVVAVGSQIMTYMNYSQRMQLFHYLVSLAQADGNVCSSELKTLRDIASAMGLNNADIESILAMFGNDIESAYKVLEIDSNATDNDVKAAYKRLAIKHHPDKVASLGMDVQKAAEEKFKNIQNAYEKIKKERGIS